MSSKKQLQTTNKKCEFSDHNQLNVIYEAVCNIIPELFPLSVHRLIALSLFWKTLLYLSKQEHGKKKDGSDIDN